jgi:hypothetical protein
MLQREVTDHIDAVMRSEGSDGELSYPTVLMARDEATWPYGKSNDDTTHIVNPAIEPIQTVRAGARVNGQCCDVARTYLYETATQEMIDAYAAVLAAEEAIITSIVPGVSVSFLDGILQSELSTYIAREDVQYSYFWGHGIGEFALMDPVLSNETEPMSLEEGLILGIQVYLYFEAGWFVRVEDTCLVTSSGVSVLSDAPKSLEDIQLFSNGSLVEIECEVDGYAYDSLAFVDASIADTQSRAIQQVSFFDGNAWSQMVLQSPGRYTHQYLLDKDYASFVICLVRVDFQEETVYLTRAVGADLEPTYEQVLNPMVTIVVEGVTTDETMTWTFSKSGADMIRLHFLRVYPPPGDQFLVKDLQGRVVFEYKWNLGAEATSPWIPGSVAVVEVVPQWMSIYGGVNHFYFDVDIMGVFDPEATTTSSQATSTSSTSTSTSSSATGSATSSGTGQSPYALAVAGLVVGTAVIVVVYLMNRRVIRQDN